MDRKKFLFVSLDGLIADIAWQVVKEGHEVKLFVEAQSEREIADGFVPKTEDWIREVPWTGEIGTTMFWSEPTRLFNATLKKMETRLREERYVGYIDVNCMVNSNGVYPLEFTSRFGYPTISIQPHVSRAVGDHVSDGAGGGRKLYRRSDAVKGAGPHSHVSC
ncbi:MAG: hypothetical protein E6H70_04135 [Betaproteobacteria bacterium]|nr:MAG: hypothetical protein E6H70_04135 [Betaproteobacteria bacterium]